MSSHIEEALAAILTATYGEEVRQAFHDALEEALTVKNNTEVTTNKITEIDANSTDTQYVSAKAIYDALETKLSSATGSVKTDNIDTGAVTEAKLAAALRTIIDAKMNADDATVYHVDTTTQTLTYDNTNPKTMYLNARVSYGNVSNRTAVVISTSGKGYQFAITVTGDILMRNGGGTYPTDWTVLYGSSYKKNSINDDNKNSSVFIPTIGAVVSYLVANYTDTTALNTSLNSKADVTYVDNGLNTKADSSALTAKADVTYVDNRVNTKADVTYVDSRLNTKADVTYVDNGLNTKADSGALTAKENLSNKITTRENLLINKNSTDKYPAAKAIVDYIAALFATVINNDNKSSNALLPTIKAIVDYLTANYTDTTALNTLLNRKMDTAYAEDLRNRVNELDISMEPDPDNMEYPSAYAVWMIANNVYNDLSLDISGNSADIADNSADIADIQAYLGYTESDILGLHADFQNKEFTRLAGAEGLTAGSDFDDFSMFGGRRRCNVADDGTINAFYGDAGYTEDGTNGQVMVYQPKFYYKVVPLKLEKQASGLGYHIRKANYYVTGTPHAGFKPHPLFYDANGNEVDYVLLSAYEGSLYVVSAGVYINDNAPGDYVYAQGDLLCSVAGKKPVSGKLAGIGTKANFEAMAQAHSSGWHLDTIKSVSANQLLMAIEFAHFNTQNAIGLGVVTNSGSAFNCSSLTGSTAALGNATGMADATVYENGTETVSNTANGKVSVSYRGVENLWGNIWKHTNGINLWGDGNMGGGQVYIAEDFNFNESVKGDVTVDNTHYRYSPTGFSVANGNGFVSAFGYCDEKYDWLLIASAVNENNANDLVPVGDTFVGSTNLNNSYCIYRYGSHWNYGTGSGGFCSACNSPKNTSNNSVGGRLLYVPTAVE